MAIDLNCSSQIREKREIEDGGRGRGKGKEGKGKERKGKGRKGRANEGHNETGGTKVNDVTTIDLLRSSVVDRCFGNNSDCVHTGMIELLNK